MSTNDEVEKCCHDIFDVFAKNNTSKTVAALALTLILNQLKKDGVVIEQHLISPPKNKNQVH